MKNIYLIGMMGSGKTTTGRSLARLLSRLFVDLDDQIVKAAGKSINEIFRKNGEPYFRSVEHKLLLEASRKANLVVATGGGIILDPDNRIHMTHSGLVIYLKSSLDILWRRVEHKLDRPLLAGGDPKKSLTELYSKRIPLYEMSASKTFLTDFKSPEQVALEIYKACFEENEENNSSS